MTRVLGILIAVVLASGVVTAGASPPSGVTRTDHARATISTPTSASATGESDVAGQFVVVPPGGSIPWHSHPGQNFVAVSKGALTVYVGGAQDCTTSSYPAAQGYLEHIGMVHSAKNDGTDPVEAYVTQVGVPVGAELRKVEAKPAGAACPELSGPAPTVTNLVRAKISAPFTLPETPTSDVMMQTVVIQPGGTVGWHSHASPTFVAVKSGTLNFFQATAAGCTSQSYTAGQGYVEPVGDAHMARNDSAAPVEIYATYLGVAVGGALRAEHEIPTGANCPAAATAPAAAEQLPRTGLPAGSLLTLAAALVGAGSVARRLGRRR